MSTEVTSRYHGVYKNASASVNIGAVCRRFRTRLFRKRLRAAYGDRARCHSHAYAAGVPVMCTNAVYHGEALNGGRFSQKAKPMRDFLEGRPLSVWPACFDVSDDELVVSKQYPTALLGASLASALSGVDVCCALAPFR
jgi:hypothetical protein